MASVFFSYCHVDEDLRDRLEEHLAMLKHEKLITAWHDRRILAGASVDNDIDENLETADIILLLVSSAFLNSAYCFSREMARALELDKAKKARVIPIMLRPCDWKTAPFSGLKIIPRDAKPVVLWPNQDEAFTDIAREIRRVVNDIEAQPDTATPQPAGVPTATSQFRSIAAADEASESLPRSSNMRVRKEFTDFDKDRFGRDTFDFMVRFFQGSLTELENRHPEFQGRFEQVDSRRFSASIYRAGAAVAECTISLGGHSGGGREITYADGIASHVSGYNESLMMSEDALALFFKPMMNFGGSREEQFSPSGAAEYYWSKLMDHIQ